MFSLERVGKKEKEKKKGGSWCAKWNVNDFHKTCVETEHVEPCGKTSQLTFNTDGPNELTSYTEHVAMRHLESANWMWTGAFLAYRNVLSSVREKCSFAACVRGRNTEFSILLANQLDYLFCFSPFHCIAKKQFPSSPFEHHTHSGSCMLWGFATWLCEDSHRGHDFVRVMLTLWDSVSFCSERLNYWNCRLDAVVWMCIFCASVCVRFWTQLDLWVQVGPC